MNLIINKAKEFAYKAHENQKRKGKESSYTNHLDLAYAIGKEITLDENILASIWLHDTVEDTSITMNNIYNKFGKTIGDYITVETENKSLSWKERKTNQINYFRKYKNEKFIIIAFSDKLANLMEIEQDIRISGNKIFNKFNASKEEQKWYYNEFYKIFNDSKQIPEKFKKLYYNINKIIFDD